MLRPEDAPHQQVGWGPGPSWKRPAARCHGACRYGNQTSAAGLQQRQEDKLLSCLYPRSLAGGGWRDVGQSGSLRLMGAGGEKRRLPAVLLQRPGGHKLPEWSLIHPPTVPVLTLPPTWCALPPLVLGLAGGWRAPSCQSCHTIYLLPFTSRIGPCFL